MGLAMTQPVSAGNPSTTFMAGWARDRGVIWLGIIGVLVKRWVAEGDRSKRATYITELSVNQARSLCKALQEAIEKANEGTRRGKA